MAFSVFSLFVAVAAYYLDDKIDTDGLSEMRGFYHDMKVSAGRIWSIRHVPEISNMFIYALLSGMITPNFGEFYYYYVTNIKHVS